MAALATAILSGSTSIERLDEILSRGPEIADMSFRDPLGRSLMHIASASGDVRALRWLFQHGADMSDTTRPGGDTAIHLAVSEGHLDTVKYLLEEVAVGVPGANAAGESALDIALNSGFDDIVRVITRHLRPPAPTPQSVKGINVSSNRDKVDSNPHSPSEEEQQCSGHWNDAHKAQPRNTQSGFTTTVEPLPLLGKGPRQVDIVSYAPSIVTAKTGPRIPPFNGRGVTSGGFFVAGAWSKAGVRSCFNLRHGHLLGKHGVVFDMGVCPSEVVHAQHVFVTHGHLDHCGAICSHARLRALRGNLPGKYYMHAELAEGMAKVREAFEAVDESSIAMEIVPVSPESSVELGQGCFVRPFLVQHRVKALGFALIRRHTEGLKKEFRGMDGKTLGDLKKQGVEISTFREVVEVVYTGDTTILPLLSLPQVWKARLLIMEVSYLDGDSTAAAKTHHIHIQDLLDNADKLDGVEQLLIAHVSSRYGSYLEVLKLLVATLPCSVVKKVSVALGEFGAPTHLTFLEDYVEEVSPSPDAHAPQDRNMAQETTR